MKMNKMINNNTKNGQNLKKNMQQLIKNKKMKMQTINKD
jgi:hypothetical protein